MPLTPVGHDITLGQVALTVGDVAASTAFYRDAIGVPFLFARHSPFSTWATCG